VEEKKDKAAIGLNGGELDRVFTRKVMKGEKTTLANMAVMVSVCRRLQEHFPDIPVLCEEDTDLLTRDEEFAGTVASFLSDYGIIEGATAESVGEWSRHAGTYLGALKRDMTLPTTYWALMPVDTTPEFVENKQYCMSLALIKDGKPVVSAIGCPVLVFDHISRSVPMSGGCPVFYATAGGGAWTQLVQLERNNGVYQGKYRIKGPSIKLNVSEKIKRGHDGLYDFLGSEQLRIAMGSRSREDIFRDAERIGKILGSDYPKFDFINSAMKYCWLARGEADVVWYLRNGLYDDTATERLIHHAAGVLVAEESGAAVADLDGKPLDWCGPILENNRGVFATDPKKVPLLGIRDAVKSATAVSVTEYERRCEKRKEVAKMLSYIFSNVGKFAESDEEKAAARKVKEKGMKLLMNDQEMDQIAQDQMNRESPILGESATEDDPFGPGDGSIPMSPIGGDDAPLI
jgi:3'(2'), 5'-bisphosphate nucleotidase